MKKIAAATLLLFSVSACFGAKSSIKIGKDKFTPGEDIVVQFTASPDYATDAWIGIIPSDIAHGSEALNDQHDVTYQYLQKKADGTLAFKAPLSPGKYDFRMNDTDNNGKEVVSVSFVVDGPAPAAGPLVLSKSQFTPGEDIAVQFTATENFPRDAWVGIIPSAIPHGQEAVNDQHDLTYQYLEGRQNGTLVFKAPPAPGTYDFRMHSTDNNGVEVGSVSFQVK